MIEIYIALAIIATGMFVFALLVKPTKHKPQQHTDN